MCPRSSPATRCLPHIVTPGTPRRQRCEHFSKLRGRPPARGQRGHRPSNPHRMTTLTVRRWVAGTPKRRSDPEGRGWKKPSRGSDRGSDRGSMITPGCSETTSSRRGYRGQGVKCIALGGRPLDPGNPFGWWRCMNNQEVIMRNARNRNRTPKTPSTGTCPYKESSLKCSSSRL